MPDSGPHATPAKIAPTKIDDRAILPDIGTRFGRLVLISVPPARPGWGLIGNFRCDCGNEKIIRVRHARAGRTSSCGCYYIERRSEIPTKHGMARRAEYKIWKGIKKRCSNPAAVGFEHYGGRGIRICPRWAESFSAFFADMGARPSPGHSIDRINNDGHYEPGNCRWATAKQQAANRRERRRHA